MSRYIDFITQAALQQHVQTPSQHTTLRTDTEVTETQDDIQNPQNINYSLSQWLLFESLLLAFESFSYLLR